jgi:hypothetical protein
MTPTFSNLTQQQQAQLDTNTRTVVVSFAVRNKVVGKTNVKILTKVGYKRFLNIIELRDMSM